MTHTRTKTQVQRSIGSKGRVDQTNRRTKTAASYNYCFETVLHL